MFLTTGRLTEMHLSCKFASLVMGDCADKPRLTKPGIGAYSRFLLRVEVQGHLTG
jgi:hypothetical protein